jgi:hypothetical protein
MKKQIIYIIVIISLLLCPIHYISYAKDLTLSPSTPIQVYFFPNGGCTDTIINEIDQAKTEILVQAYSFTSAPIASTYQYGLFQQCAEGG